MHGDCYSTYGRQALLCLMKSVKNPGKRVQYLETAVKSADLGLMLGKGVQKLLSRMATAITAALERGIYAHNLGEYVLVRSNL